jgi:hypothetical protein
MGVVFYKRIEPFFANGGGQTISESFEFSEGWPGTGNGEYIIGFTGFNSPSANIEESFEFSEGWPGTS